ncbi:hypothetical protein B7463_g3210, partial [Scytalidium lignicola]
MRGIPCVVEGAVLPEGLPIAELGHSVENTQTLTQEPHDSLQTSTTRTFVLARPEQYVGLSSDLDPFILRHHNWPIAGACDDQNGWSCYRRGKDPLNPVHFEVFPAGNVETFSSHYLESLAEEAVRPSQEDLFQAYARHIHPAYPLLGPHEAVVSCVSSTLRTSIYFLAHSFCSSAQSIDPRLYEDFNSRALLLEARFATLETVEAALLFVQRHAYFSGLLGMHSNHIEIANITAMSNDLGLNVDPQDWEISEAEKRRRRRIWWAIYIQDKWSALALGRPSFLNDDQANVRMLRASDFAFDECQAPPEKLRTGTEVFVAMALLTQILSDILSTFYTIRGIERCMAKSEDDLFSICASFESDLDNWQEHYLNSLLNSRSFPDCTGSIELAAYTVIITLYRALLPKLSRLNALVYYIRRKASCAVSKVVGLLEGLTLARFRELLQMHRNGFPVTHHATARLHLLTGARPIGDESRSESPATTP